MSRAVTGRSPPSTSYSKTRTTSSGPAPRATLESTVGVAIIESERVNSAGPSRCLLFLIILATVSGELPASESEVSGTVPFIFDDNRIFAELKFVRTDGTLRNAVAYVDLGTPKMVIEQKLREELQADVSKP